jgi:hypothetical protein
MNRFAILNRTHLRTTGSRLVALTALTLSAAAVRAEPLDDIFQDMGSADLATVKMEAASQAARQPNYRSRRPNDLVYFDGYYTPTSADAKLAIFSDDGCTVKIDDVAVHTKRGEGQHLPDIENQSFHVLNFTFEADRAYGV